MVSMLPPSPPAARQCSASACCTRRSVSASMAEVASSSAVTRARRSVARATHSNCRWPCERFFPCSATAPSRPSSCSKSWRPMWHMASTSGSSELKVPKGSRFERKEPLKITGSCGMMDSLLRSVRRPSVEMSTPSMCTAPPQGSANRKSTVRRLDFPAPVRPQMPTRSPGCAAKDTPFNTRSPSRKRSFTPSNATPPQGQVAGSAMSCAFTKAGSCGTLSKLRTRSHDVRCWPRRMASCTVRCSMAVSWTE
mmetsp:Transcript_26171/g.61023  ORF Transcript_26171/g.61023 Transcript_26171/m.61023 type:complete len:252 (+) Transcript_26171:277-1032(+)